MALIQLTLEEVNSLPSNDFIKVFGNIIERYPTAAIKILKFRPFCKVDDLIDAFNNYLDGLNIVGKLFDFNIETQLHGNFTHLFQKKKMY